jgi:beta-aspartyl-peptidase (threonine type)
VTIIRWPHLLVALPLVAVALLEAGCRRAPVSSPALPPTDQDAVRQVLLDQQAAWNRGDLEAFMGGYWHSPDLTFFSGGSERHGWDDTLARYRQRYQGEGREMGRLTFDDLRVEVVAPDVAYVRGRWQVVTSKETLGGLFTLIFRKFPEGWRIVHDHTSSS